MELRGVISKIRAKWGMVIIGDIADPDYALCIHKTWELYPNFTGHIMALPQF